MGRLSSGLQLGMVLNEKKLERPQNFAEEYISTVDESDVNLIQEEIMQTFMDHDSGFG